MATFAREQFKKTPAAGEYWRSGHYLTTFIEGSLSYLVKLTAPAEALAPVTAPAPAITAVPAAIPPPPAAKAPPPTAAREAFVRAAPESELIAVPVLAAPSKPAPPAAAATAGAATKATPPVATAAPTMRAVFPGFSLTLSIAPPNFSTALSPTLSIDLPKLSTDVKTLFSTKSSNAERNSNQPMIFYSLFRKK
ncbi:hypothetical protein Lferr_1310 [Acidithiobacillus ferrooxidans ATCC 53993]|nr:hypothetical protein Lferr_1310 [Acidithiobacillus ferrooxidans ATCC 53993]